jgi:DNA polymerase III subunit epsilon
MALLVAVDIETTGFGSKDRIVEIGCVIFDEDSGQVVGELETLINPMRNIPEASTDVHGLVADNLSLAPTFEEIAASLYQVLSGNRILGHKVRFDLQFIEREFQRIGMNFSAEEAICTFEMTGQALPAAAAAIAYDFDSHAALEDAKACLAIWTTHSLDLRHEGLFSKELILQQSFRTLTRSQLGLTELDSRRTTLSNLRLEVQEEGNENTYIGLLDAYLRDLKVNDIESLGLSELALDLSISKDRQLQLKDSYLSTIEKAALRDGIITTAEADFFNRISISLNSQRRLSANQSSRNLPAPGSLVCVTGTATVGDVHFNKETIASLLELYGYVYTDTLSKKSGVALLLQDSEGSQSSKVTKAQAWGIPRMVIADFVNLVSN